MAKRKPTAAELAAQAQSTLSVTLFHHHQSKFNLIIFVLALNTVALSISMATLAPLVPVGSVLSLIWMKFLIFLFIFIQLILVSS